MNYLKKQEQHNIRLVVGDRGNKDLYRISYIYIQKIIPDRVIIDKNVYEITYIDERYHLDGFEITTENDKVHIVKVFGFHPNCDPDTDNFCLPDFKKGVEFTSEYLNMILTNIKTYYLDNCFFNPTGRKLRYEKMRSIFVQLNG